jgi:hypothetical protein
MAVNYTEELNLDLSYGKDREKALKQTLEEYFGMTLDETPPTCSWDFENLTSGVRVELKSRRFDSRRYTDTYITKRKLLKSLEYEGTTYFVFEFTDGCLMTIDAKECLSCKVVKVKTHLGEKRNNLLVPMNAMLPIKTAEPVRCLIVL